MKVIVCDIIYNPRKTKLLQQAEEVGCEIINGVGDDYLSRSRSL